MVYTYEYLPWRGVSADTFRFYDAKTKIDQEGKPVCIGFQYANGAYKVRDRDRKDFRWSKLAPDPVPGLYGKDKFAYGSNKYVAITEGELDALSLHQAAGIPVVSVRSAATALRDCSADLQWLRSFERVYLAFDGDVAGRDATAAVAKLFEHGRVYVVRFDPRKDANDWLRLVDGEDQLKNIFWNSKVYLPENILSGIDTFETILEGEPEYGIPYPFQFLTDMTYGLRTGETVLIKAPEKVGKTTFTNYLMYNLLKRTEDNVGIISLEQPPKRFLQSLVGFELRKPAYLPDSNVTMAERSSALKQVVREDNRLFVYSYFGSMGGDILSEDIRYLVAALGCRWIGLDPISIVSNGFTRALDERRELEYLSTRLEMLVKELDFGLIMVSHVNDFGQTRGSHYLTKVADITIDLSRDTSNSNSVNRSELVFTIPFNRYCGKTGFAGKVLFDEARYSYTELPPEGIEHGTQQKDVPFGTEKSEEATQKISIKEFLPPLDTLGRNPSASLWRNKEEETLQASVTAASNDNAPPWHQGAVA